MISSLNKSLLVLIIAFCSTAFSQDEWLTDIDQAKQKASAEGKLVVLHFYADWCSPCQQLDKFVFNQHLVQDLLKNQVVAVKVDVDLHPDWVSEYSVKGIPYDVIITPNGNVVDREKSPGTSDKYLAMLKRVVTMGDRVANTDPAVLEETLRLQAVMTEKRSNAKAIVNPTIDFNESPVDFRPSKTTLNATSGQFSSTPNEQQSESIAAFRPTTPIAPSTLEQQAQITRQVQESAKPQTEFKLQTNPFVQGQVASGDFKAPKPQRVYNELAASSEYDSQPRNPLFAPGSIQNNDSVKAKIRTEPWNQEPAAKVEPAIVVNKEKVIAAKPTYALSGNCPVSLLTQSKWIAGNEEWGCTHRGKTYVFANKSAMDLFMQRPDDFSPVLAGFDPVAFHETGELVDGKEALGVFMSKNGVQKVVLFVNEMTRDQFQNNPKVYLESVRIATQRLRQTTIR